MTTTKTNQEPAARRKRTSNHRTARPSTSGRPAAVKRASSLKLRTILVPVDFSECSRTALTYAIRLARDFDGALVVLHVLDPLLIAGRLESTRLRQLKSLSRKEAEGQLQAFGSELVKSGVRTQLLLRHGPATEVILVFAAKMKPDLIIMGSRGRTGLRRLLIGSVAERVVRHAECPVLIVR